MRFGREVWKATRRSFSDAKISFYTWGWTGSGSLAFLKLTYACSTTRVKKCSAWKHITYSTH